MRPLRHHARAAGTGVQPSSTPQPTYIFYALIPLAPASVDELNRIATELRVGALATETKGDH
jgi:hypothetical protein